jgi:hypothetical protein
MGPRFRGDDTVDLVGGVAFITVGVVGDVVFIHPITMPS